MKKYFSGVFLTALFFSFLFIACSDSGGADSDSYIISFKIDGTLYEFTSGYNDVSGQPEGNDYNGTNSYFAAVPSGSANNDDVFVMIRVNGTTTGLYDDSGDDNDLNFYYCFNTANHRWKDDDSAVADFTMIITKYEEIGGILEGTFEGPVINNDTSATAILTDGYFHVERIADGSLTAPW